MIDNEPDPLAPQIDQLLEAGWKLMAQVTSGIVEHALVHVDRDWMTYDVVTVPPPGGGQSTIVRLPAGYDPRWPRAASREVWRHHAPTEQALAWLLRGFPPDDRELFIPSWRGVR